MRKCRIVSVLNKIVKPQNPRFWNRKIYLYEQIVDNGKSKRLILLWIPCNYSNDWTVGAVQLAVCCAVYWLVSHKAGKYSLRHATGGINSHNSRLIVVRPRPLCFTQSTLLALDFLRAINPCGFLGRTLRTVEMLQ